MPMHDWTRVTPNAYHDFHGRWIYAIRDRLNKGILPAGYYAQAEQVIVPLGPDVLTLQSPSRNGTGKSRSAGGLALAAKPTARAWERSLDDAARPRRQVAIRHNSGDAVVAAVEVVSPANKRSQDGFRAFVRKAVRYLRSGVHLLVVDPFAPGPRDRHGMHAVIWRRYGQTPRPRPDGPPLTAVSYSVGKRVTVYLEAFDLGDPVPDMPLFLTPGKAVTVPLEAAYAEAWDNVPEVTRGRLAA